MIVQFYVLIVYDNGHTYTLFAFLYKFCISKLRTARSFFSNSNDFQFDFACPSFQDIDNGEQRLIADELENMEVFNVTWQVFPIDTMINKQKLHQLGEFFPSVAVDMRRDVLAAANDREDVAAAMLGI
ncbi:hypothetical protein Plhal703r1_c15g0074471 [Plasmopara halstedii]